MQKRLLILASLGIAGFGHLASANRYGMAGCGLGAGVYMDKPGKVQILAATTNNILSPQTSAISSGTSGCVEDSQRVASLFLQINHDAVKKDISRGQGETLASLARIYQCSSPESLGKTLQQNYQSIYPEASTLPANAAEHIKATIQNNNELRQSCAVLS